MSKTVVHAKRNAFPSIFDYGNCFPLNESIYKLPLGHEMSTWRITFRVDALVGKPYRIPYKIILHQIMQCLLV